MTERELRMILNLEREHANLPNDFERGLAAGLRIVLRIVHEVDTKVRDLPRNEEGFLITRTKVTHD